MDSDISGPFVNLYLKFSDIRIFWNRIFYGLFMAPRLSKVAGCLKLSKNRRFCFAIFSVKNASTEKTEYTTATSAEKGRR